MNQKISLKLLLLCLLFTGFNLNQASAGSIVRLYYDGIAGTGVTNLTQDPTFPNTPVDQEVLADLFEGTSNRGDDYGSYIRGYLEAPQTGNYTFWIASDDDSELWLSTDATPANKKLIAWVLGYTGAREWTKYAAQKSTNTITLTRGQKYYVEVLQKDGTGGDNLAVGWQLPDGGRQRPIPGISLMPWKPGAALAITLQPQPAMVVESTPATFFVNVEAGTPPAFQWYKGGQAIPDAILSSYNIPKPALGDNNNAYYVMINGTLKSDTVTLSVVQDVLLPALVSANAMGYDNFVEVVVSEPITIETATNTANYSIDGGAIAVNKAVLMPDNVTIRLFTAPFEPKASHALAVNGLNDLAATPNTLNGTINFGQVTGSITRKYYLNTGGGTAVTDLRNAATFPASPDIIEPATFFEGRTDWADNYGSMIQGYIVPTTAGSYKFAISSDDNSALYWSTDDTPANLRRTPIATVNTYTSSRQFTKEANQQSAAISLQAGKRYYVEALQKEGGGGDNLAVAWQDASLGDIADGTEPIPGANLIPWVETVVPLAITQQPASQNVTEARSVTFTVATAGYPACTGAQWYRGGQPIPDASGLSYTISRAALEDNQAVFSVVVTNLAASVQSQNATLSVTKDSTPPSVILAATRLGTTVQVEFSELVDAATATTKENYSIAGVAITAATLSADGKTVNLAISGSLPANFEITLNNIKDLVGNVIAPNTKAPGYTTGLAPEMISYWPLNEVQGAKTPDVISGYDMNLDNLTASDIVDGRFGKCLQFDNARKTMLYRVNSPGDQLPIYNHAAFTVSLWVKGAGMQPDRRVFSESSSKATQPLFNIGTHNGAADGTVDSYIRNDAGTFTINHAHSAGIGYDDTWHHLCWVQNSNATTQAALYIDGVKDASAWGPVWPLTIDTTTIGGIRRATTSAWFTGLIDDVAIWSRALDQEEVTFLFTKGTPTPPPKVLPLVVNSFKSDLPAVAQGDTITLRWDVSKDATTVEIQPNIGDVTAKTSVGAGSLVITVTNSYTYRLIATRGASVVTREISVAAIGSVASGWNLLDNFDRYPIGELPSPWGVSAAGNRVVDVNGNHLLSTPGAGLMCMLPLSTLTIKEGEQHTLFARFYIDQTPAAGAIDQILGFSDKGIRGWTDANADLGPGVSYQSPDGSLQIGAFNGYGSALELSTFALQPQTVYDLWIDFRNDPIADGDLYSVYIAKDGDASRAELFKDIRSSRNPNDTTLLGPTLPDLDGLVLGANVATSVVYFDDFYLSKSGYLTTVPRADGFTTPVVSVVATAPTITNVKKDSGNISFQFGTQAGVTCVVQSRDSLASGNWQTAKTVAGTGSVETFSEALTTGTRFYQVKVQ